MLLWACLRYGLWCGWCWCVLHCWLDVVCVCGLLLWVLWLCVWLVAGFVVLGGLCLGVVIFWVAVGFDVCLGLLCCLCLVVRLFI